MSENSVKLERARVDMSFIDFGQLWSLFVINWKWFVLSVIGCVIVSLGYLWLKPGTITVTGKMEIIDKSNKSGGLSAGMAMLNSLPMGLGSAIGGSIGGSLGIESEKEVIMSNLLVRGVVKDLGLYTEYRLSRWGKRSLLYQDQPLNVSIDAAHLQWLDNELPLNYHQILLTIEKNSEGYVVKPTLRENKVKTKLPEQIITSLPATIKTEYGVLTFEENRKLTDREQKPYKKDYTLLVSIMPPVEVANDFIERLSVDPPSKKITNILDITLQDQHIIRAIDFVDNLVKAYNRRSNDEKNEEARKTDEFVNARLAKIDAELGSSDAAWENSKKNFQITEPEVDAQEVMTKKSLYESKLVEIGTELQLHDYLSEYIHNPENLYELIPIGISGGMGDLSGDVNKESSSSSNASLIAQHNTLVSQRKELLRSVSEKSPQVQRLTESIKELHPTLITAMKRDRQNIIMKRSAVEREYSKYMGRVNTAPKMERVLTEIGRQREIKQGVYLLLLQKREETAMELANTADKGKLIDETSFNKGSDKPKKKIILLVGVFLGVLLPLGILYLIKLFNTKIETPKELRSISSNPIIGEITLGNNDESIRTLRSNLLLNIEKGQKVIAFISNAEGDGKTYLAKQLADSLSAIEKKTLYLDLDLRSKSSNIHPADKFASSEFSSQMDGAKDDNDFVIIDTPALGQYNDACQIAQFVDVAIFVVKAGVTNKAAVNHVRSKSFPRLMYVINAIDMSKKQNQYFYK